MLIYKVWSKRFAYIVYTYFIRFTNVNKVTWSENKLRTCIWIFAHNRLNSSLFISVYKFTLLDLWGLGVTALWLAIGTAMWLIDTGVDFFFAPSHRKMKKDLYENSSFFTTFHEKTVHKYLCLCVGLNLHDDTDKCTNHHRQMKITYSQHQFCTWEIQFFFPSWNLIYIWR